MNRTILLSIMLMALFSCENKRNNNVTRISSDTIKADTKVFAAESEDAEMKEAITKAKNTFNEFEIAYASKLYDTSTFSIKVRFPTASGAEHIWTTNLVRRDGYFQGNIDEPPTDPTVQVKVGDRIKITRENISDWLYTDKNVLVGGYTLRVARNHMSPEERKIFDSNSKVIIRD